jgi:hypothetical protein
MTFDTTSDGDPASSRNYLQGEVAVTNGQYLLTNIEYGGDLSSALTAGTSVSGATKGIEVSFVLPSLQGYNPESDPAPLQWRMTPGGAWEINSEYSAAGAPQRSREEKSAVIYLVLDNSNSLAGQDVQIREAAKKFINTVYQKLTENE